MTTGNILIIKTGSTIQSLLALGQDFEDWIISGCGLRLDAFKVVSVFQGELLPSLDSVVGIIVTGSPAYVTDHQSWSEQTAKYLRQAVNKNTPVLGICYGHQLLAYAMGGKVSFHPNGREIGTVSINLTEAGNDDPLLGKIPTNFVAQVSHQQSVSKLPVNAVVLAFNEFEPYHGFRVGECAWGLQFHPEFSDEIIRAYIQERSLAIEAEGLDVKQLLAITRPSPDATSLLEIFTDIVRQKEAWDKSLQEPAASS